MAGILIDFLKDIIGNDILTVMILSVVPFVEARGAIPFAFGLGMSPLTAFLFCVVSATAAIPVVLFAFVPVVGLLKKFKPTRKIISGFEDVIRERSEKYSEKGKGTEKLKLTDKIVSAIGRTTEEKGERNSGKGLDKGGLKDKIVSAIGNMTGKKREMSSGRGLDKGGLKDKIVSTIERTTEEKRERSSEKGLDKGGLKDKIVSTIGNMTGKKRERSSVKAGNKEKFFVPFEYKALFLLAALPLPLTGVWSGSAVAACLKLDKGWSFAAIACGNFLSSAIWVFLLSFFSESIDLILNVFIGTMIVGIAVTVLKIIRKSRKKKVVSA
jgi:uncharacterized membrane protein